MINPFLKWAGGKRWLIPKILNKLPPFKRYYEPFLGSGSLFFALQPTESVLSDTNAELINCYKQIKNNFKEVIKALQDLPTNKEIYYFIRDSLYPKSNLIQRAAYFIYLNKTCWNGLYRVNAQGHFNVPCGNLRPNITIFEEAHIIATSRLLQNAQLKCCDFEDILSDVKKGDMVYFDPPYVTSHFKNGFIGYNSKLFSQLDEIRLAKSAAHLARKGALVIISNAAHPSIKQLYDGQFYKTEINRFSGIAADPRKRMQFAELLVTNFIL